MANRINGYATYLVVKVRYETKRVEVLPLIERDVSTKGGGH
jgi:hypothetical protein